MSILPSPITSEEDARRWYHHDLEQRPLDRRRVWAERTLVDHELARRLWHRRPRIVFVEADGPVDDVVWLEARSRRLQAVAEQLDGQ